MAKNKWFWMTTGILAIVGGAVHVLAPLGFNLLSFFGSYANWVQFIAGAGTLIFVIKKLM